MNERRARQLLFAERNRLEHVQRVLVAEHLSDTSESEATGELSSLDQHQADAGSDLFEREKDYSLLARVRDDLVDLADALDRIDRHQYGRCQSCGSTIPDERLTAMPATRFCVDHESYWEAVRMTLTPPPGPMPGQTGISIEELTELAAFLNLDLLGTDDEIAEVLTVGPEEASMHLGGPGTGGKRPSANQLEDIEARYAEEESRDRAVSAAEDEAWEHDLAAALDEDQQLDG